LGYYSDNELRWWGKDYFIISGLWTLADDYIDEAAGTPGKEAFVTLMDERYEGDIAAFNAVYSTEFQEFSALSEAVSLAYDNEDPVQLADRNAFIEAIAEQYFSNVRDALKSVAPDHLYLCARFASVAPEPVIRMAARYCDVVTFNDYYILPDPISEMALGGTPEERWASYGEIVTTNEPPRPIIVTEWGIRGDDSGLPNTFGAGFVVDTQFERSDFYRFSADWFLDRTANGLGFVAGWHWFMYIDEPPTGRFDGEDCNYGVVTLRDEKYRFVWEAMATVNRWVDNRLVETLEPSLLPPPEQVEAVSTVGGKAMVKWSSVPLATGYRVHVLSHPAGTEHRIVATHKTGATEILLDIAGYGLGTYWFGVEAYNEELLSLGPRVSNPVVAEASGYPNIPSQDKVLQCESLKTVLYFNDFPLPNDAVGQSYARAVPSFIEDGGSALQLEFLPSSLGYVTLSPAGETAFRIDISLPDEVVVDEEDSLHLSIFPHFIVLTDQQVTAATDVVWLSVLDSAGAPLAQFHLATFDLEPSTSADIFIPLDMAGIARTVRFEVDLFEPALPLESRVQIDVDNLSFSGE
jgi:agarase